MRRQPKRQRLNMVQQQKGLSLLIAPLMAEDPILVDAAAEEVAVEPEAAAPAPVETVAEGWAELQSESMTVPAVGAPLPASALDAELEYPEASADKEPPTSPDTNVEDADAALENVPHHTSKPTSPVALAEVAGEAEAVEAEGVAEAKAEGAGEDEVELKIVIQPEGFSHTKFFPASALVGAVKEGIETELRIPVATMTLFSGDDILDDDSRTLGSFGLAPPGPAELYLHISFLEKGGERSAGYVMPDVITVEIQFGPDLPSKLVQVPIQRAQQPKPFLGGYRSKKTRVEFHHACAQTERAAPSAEAVAAASNRFHRQTQTAVETTRSQQGVREASTQMEASHVHLGRDSDVILAPLPYFDADALSALRLEKIIDIQRYARCSFARHAAAKLRAAAAAASLQAAESTARKAAEIELQQAREIERRMHPRTAADFDILYRELEAWRLAETARIDAGPAGSRHAEHNALVLKQQKLLQTIDRLKLHADGEARDRHVAAVLQQMSAPKAWEMSDGDVAHVHTPFTTRAKELMELYNGLKLQHLNVDERLDVLLHVKWTVKEFDCALTRDITELIDREADMLNRGRAEATLSGLRKRLSNLFLTFLQTAEFNPEAARFSKVPLELVVRPNLRPLGGSPPVRAA